MIYVECDPDKALVSILGVPRKEIFHAGGKGNVCVRLSKTTDSKGLIDEDPESPQLGYLKKLKSCSAEYTKYNIKLLSDEKFRNSVIVLSPRLENWILEAAKEAGMNMEEYGLPNNANNLHKVINIKLESFKKLIEEMKQKSKMLKRLERLIRE